MDNLDKITTYLRDNHISLDNITPTTVHNVLSENESITINEWRDLSDEQLEKLDQLDDGRYNPIVKRGDKVVIIRFNPIVPSFNGEKGFPLVGYGWVDSMEVRKALDFTELEVITNHTDYRTEPYPGDDERTYMLFAKVMITDPENKFYKAEFRLDPEYFTWVKVEDDIDKESYHDIDLDEDLINWSYNGDEIGVIKETLEEKNKDNIDRMKSDNIRNMTMIPTSKRLASEVIYGVLSSHGYGPYSPGDTINLQQETLNGPDGYDFENRLRFDILRESLSLDKEGRGFSFEGIIAGFFGGKPAQAGLKEDIYIDGVPISVKQSNAIMNGTADAWDTGSLLGKELDGDIVSGYNLVKREIESAGLEVPTELDENTGETKYGGKVKRSLSTFETPYALLVAGKEYDVYKRRMLKTVFTSSKGVPLHWIFAGIKENGDIKYRYMSSEELIDNILNVANIHEVIGLGRNRENGFRIKSKPILTQESTSQIILPVITEQELIDETYEEEGEKLIDRIANLFGDKASRVNRKAINYIKDNPSEFLERLKVLMPELQKLTRDDVNEATKRVNRLITESINDSIDLREKKIKTRLYWWWDNEGFTLDPQVLKVMGIGPDDIYEVRRNALEYLGGLEGLSEKIYDDLTGIEEFEYEAHTIKYRINDIGFFSNLNGGGTAGAEVEVSIDPDGKIDVEMYDAPGIITTHTLQDLSWYPAPQFDLTNDGHPEGEMRISDGQTDEIYDDIQNYIIADLEAKYFDKYGVVLDSVFMTLGTEDFKPDYKPNMEVTNPYTLINKHIKNITEDSDIFGQGLLEPVEYGEYDNDEDWEKDVRGVDVDNEGEPLPTKRETSPEDMYVSPTKGIEANICNTEGFCSEQGPITFGQLKSLIDTATNKRLGSDIARGGFKTIWRLVPFFLPQLLLVSAGVTITRAINKIITPALKDTRGHKSWWGKAVLKAMDIAEGDYIPDKTLGDDPLSKIFFISDGLLSMLKDKYKLKFARYVSAVAASQPDNEIVPEWFVDDLLRDYLNQKFLLDPPLQTRTEFKKNHIIEGYSGKENMLDVMSDLYNTEYLHLNKYDLEDIITSIKFTKVTLLEDDDGSKPANAILSILPNPEQNLFIDFDIYTDIEHFNNFSSNSIVGWEDIDFEFGNKFTDGLFSEFSENIIYDVFGIVKGKTIIGMTPTIWTKGNKSDNTIKESEVDGPQQNPEVNAGDTIMFTYITKHLKEDGGIQTMKPYVVDEESVMMKHKDSANPLYLRWVKLDEETAKHLIESDEDASFISSPEDVVNNSMLSNIITQNKYELLKILFDKDTQTEPNSSEFKQTLSKFLKINDIYTQGIIWLFLRWNTTSQGQEYGTQILETLKNVEYRDLQVPPSFYKTNVFYNGDIFSTEVDEGCVDGYGSESGNHCECEEWEIWEVEIGDGETTKIECVDATKAQLLEHGDCECFEYEPQYVNVEMQTPYSNNFLSTDTEGSPSFDVPGGVPVFFDDTFGDYDYYSNKGYWEVEIDESFESEEWHGWTEENQITEIVTNVFHLTGPKGALPVNPYPNTNENLKPRWVIVESDGSPTFNRKETTIMKMVHDEFDKKQLEALASNQQYGLDGAYDQYVKILRIFGENKPEGDLGKNNSRFAKWVWDNWNEEGDYLNLENPVKAELHWYNGTLNTSGEQVEYRSGDVEVLAWDEEDATQEISDNFYDWGGEQETYDWGDYNEYDSEVEDVRLMDRLLDESFKIMLEKNIKGNEEMVVGDRVMLINMDDPWAVTPYSKGTVVEVQPFDPATSPKMNMQDTKTSYVVSWDSSEPGANRTMKLLGGIDRWMKIDSDELEDIGTTRVSIDESFDIDRDAGVSPDLKEGDNIIIIRNNTGVQIPLYTELEVKKQQNVEDSNYPDFNSEMLYVTNKTIYDSGGIGSAFLALTKFGNSHLLDKKERWRRDKISWLKITKDDTVLNEHGADTSWANDDDKVTLQEILELTKDIPIISYPTKELAKLPSLEKIVLGWNPEEIERISQVEVSRQYPILVMVNEYNEVQWILDGNHRAQQAVMNDIPTIPAKLIKPSDLDERSIKMFYPEGIPGTNQTISEHSNIEDEHGYGEVDVQTIVDNVYPHIVDNLGPSEYNEETPNVEVWNDIYARYSGIPEMRGEDSETTKAEWKAEDNTIYVYYPNMSDTEDIIRSLLHEYTHSLQNPDEREENRKDGYELDPDEIAAHKAEENWKDYLVYIKSNLNEHEKSKKYILNPELELGDKILVISVDREVENNTTKYNIPPPELKPDLYVSYVVVDKESNGSASKYPFRYTLVPEDNLEDYGRYEALHNNPLYQKKIGAKLLFPWIYQWIRDDDDDIITEHKESRLNPQLMIGDEILVVSSKGIHDFGSPELYKPYVVVGLKYSGIYGGNPTNKWRADDDSVYYQIEPIGMTDEERTGAMLAGGGRMTPLYIFPPEGTYEGKDQWILRPEFRRGELNEDDGHINDMVYIDKPIEKHIKKMSKGLGKFENFPIQDFMNIPPPPNESDTTEDEIEHIKSIPVDKEFVDTTDKIDQHFKVFLNEKGLEWPQEDIDNIMDGVKTIILRLKYHYNRPRPGQIANEKDIKLNPTTLDSASTPSYPSGHATQGRVIGKYLSDLYPEYSEELLKLGHDVGHGRLMAKVHYPSDQSFGIELADALYEYIGNHEIELDEYCPMGNPNKCEIVDYDTLPDMVHEQAFSWDGTYANEDNGNEEIIEFEVPGETGYRNKYDTYSKHSPPLELGDVIMVIKVDGEHAGMPEIGVEYKVMEVGGGTLGRYDLIYDLLPADFNCDGLKKCDYIRKIKRIYRGDRWIKLDKEDDKILQESEVNEELYKGDVIMIIKTDSDRENGETTYRTMPPELRPERHVPYIVTEKVYAGKEWSWNYTIVPQDKFEDYKRQPKPYQTHTNEHGELVHYEKLMYPWIYQWIRLEEGLGFKEDKNIQLGLGKTINEQKSFMTKSDEAMEKARKEALRRGLLNSLDMLFDVRPYKDGEITHNDVNMGIYHKETGQFVPIDYVYDPIMENMGMEVTEADLQLFIDIITEWVNMSMVPDSVEEYVN